MKRTWMTLAGAALVLVGCPTAYSGEAPKKVDVSGQADMLSAEEVTKEKIKSICDAALMDTELDDDGDVKITDGGVNCYISVLSKRKRLRYSSYFGLKTNVSMQKKLEFVNKLNKDLIFVRFYISKPDRMVCDYSCFYRDGVSPKTVLRNARLFVAVVKGAASNCDPDDIIGSSESFVIDGHAVAAIRDSLRQEPLRSKGSRFTHTRLPQEDLIWRSLNWCSMPCAVAEIHHALLAAIRGKPERHTYVARRLRTQSQNLGIK